MARRSSGEGGLLFLFGAGSSIPAGVKSTDELTEGLLKKLDDDPFLLTHNWLHSLWKVINHHAKISSYAMGPYQPNFEHLIYAVDLLEDYIEVAQVADKEHANNEYVNAVTELGITAPLRRPFAAISYALLPITIDARLTNPFYRQIRIKGASAKFMWASRALRRLLAEQMPSEHDLSFLESFKEIFDELPQQITVATTNYDLVWDQFLSNHSISFDDGFDIGAPASKWKGFDHAKGTVRLLKLHGSLNWFQIKQNWFEIVPEEFSPNDVYKVPERSVIGLLKQELTQKEAEDSKHRFWFDVPHLIMGGNKDRKILDAPYVEINREWAKEVSTAQTIVFVGVGGVDYHLLQQIRGLICTNATLKKIIIVNPDFQAFERMRVCLGLSRSGVMLFYVESNWNLKTIESEYKLPFSEMVTMPVEELVSHYKSKLSA